MIIQAILLVIAAVFMLLFIRHWYSVQTRALKRLAFLVFIALMVVAILRPNWVNSLAHKVGVGRGTDLVVYALAVAFVFVSVNTYFRLKTQEARFTELARAIAVRDATEMNAQRLGRAVVHDAPAREAPVLGTTVPGNSAPGTTVQEVRP
jgi:small membrane protein